MNKLPFFLYTYSLIVSVIIFISGVVSVKNNQELILQLLFLPILGYFLITLFNLITRKKGVLPEISMDTSGGQIILSLIIFITLFGLGLIRIITK
jgi:hypothetical protein